jgi:hypothetical protein
MNHEQKTNAGRQLDLKSPLVITTLQFENR